MSSETLDELIIIARMQRALRWLPEIGLAEELGRRVAYEIEGIDMEMDFYVERPAMAEKLFRYHDARAAESERIRRGRRSAVAVR